MKETNNKENLFTITTNYIKKKKNNNIITYSRIEFDGPDFHYISSEEPKEVNKKKYDFIIDVIESLNNYIRNEKGYIYKYTKITKNTEVKK